MAVFFYSFNVKIISMKLKHIVLPLLMLFISSCSTNVSNDSNTNSSSTNTNNVEPGTPSNPSDPSSDNNNLSLLNPMNEPLIHNQLYLNHVGDIYNTWKSYQGKGTTIAIIDTEFKANHEDFTFEDGTSKIHPDSCVLHTSGNTTMTDPLNLSKNVGNSHGTMCAGIAAAGINNKGIIGIAPLAKLMLLETDAKPKTINAAFRYAADHGATVISISLGAYNNSITNKVVPYPDGDLYDDGTNDFYKCFDDAVSYCRNKNVPVISAAGNGNEGGNAEQAVTFTYPGASIGVIGVGGLAFNSSTERWDGSSYNPDNVNRFCDVFAPSEWMYTTVCHSGLKYGALDDNYKGTSFAAPIVAGMAALYFEKNPNNTVDQFEHDLYQSSVALGTNATRYQFGYGRVDVGALLGTTLTGNTEIKLINTGDLNVYMWNSRTGAEQSAWPGQAVSSLTFNVNSSQFDSIIFNAGDSVKSPDILISSFVYGNSYDLDDNHLFNSLYVGKYK